MKRRHCKNTLSFRSSFRRKGFPIEKDRARCYNKYICLSLASPVRGMGKSKGTDWDIFQNAKFPLRVSSFLNQGHTTWPVPPNSDLDLYNNWFHSSCSEKLVFKLLKMNLQTLSYSSCSKSHIFYGAFRRRPSLKKNEKP